MNTLINGSAGGLLPTRISGTKTRVAGKTMYLPNNDATFVMQKLTLSQIAALPKDQYSVGVIVPKKQFTAASISKLSHVSLAVHKQQHLLMGIRNDVVCFVNKPIHGNVNGIIDGDKEITTIITLVNQLKQESEKLDEKRRVNKSIQNVDILPNSGIFYSPINENLLAVCIWKIINRFFGYEATGTICDKTYNLPEFCLLMYYYFIRIGILQNTTRKPFCLYLLKKVFEDESKFSVKTFNNYANDPRFVNVEKDFTNPERLGINFRVHPAPCGNTLQEAFHEIGWAFHRSEFFEELREQRKHLETFRI